MRANRKVLVLWILVGAAAFSVTPTAAETPRGEPSAALTQEAASTSLHRLPRLQGFSGQSDTLMPNGTALELGGELGSAYRNTAFTVNPLTGATSELSTQLNYGRAWHSATILPDGSVLVFGGIGSGNEVVEAVELLNPAGTQFQTLSVSSPAGRAYHTATLLTDGRILIAGGEDANGNVLNTAVLWDYRTGIASSIQLLTPRMKHEAALLPDGTVLIWGGVDANGNAISNGEIIDPVSATVQSQSNPVLPAGNPNPPQLEVSIPTNLATDVPLTGVIVLRFSKPLNVSSVNANTVVLTGPAGKVLTAVVPAEEGMLVFITPAMPLESAAAYTVSISGITDNSGQSFATTNVDFSTTSAGAAADDLGGNLSSDPGQSSSSQQEEPNAEAIASVPASGDSAPATATTALTATGLTPTSLSYFSNTHLTFDQVQQAVGSIQSSETSKAMVVKTMASGGCGTQGTTEIVALATALDNDPDLIYQYVHDNIEFDPLYGALKGPVGTLLDGRGDAFDQAALMVALLNQAAYATGCSTISNVNFEIGKINLSSAQLKSWLGGDGSQGSIESILNSGGIPYTSVDTSGDVTGMGHAWVQVTIGSGMYVFDPAFKSHTWKTGIVSSLAGIMGYSQSGFVAAAGSPTITSDSISGINRNALRTALSSYANTLASYIKTNLPTAGVSDVVGGGVIVPTSLSQGQTVRQSSLSYQNGTPTASTSIPAGYCPTLSITLPGLTTATIYNSENLYGHRLSIFFGGSSPSLVPSLYLDGTIVATGTTKFATGASAGIAFKVTIPWNTNFSQSHTQYISAQTSSNNAGYIVMNGWDQAGRGMIEKYRRMLNQDIAGNLAANSEQRLGDSLEVEGYTWLAEVAAQQQLSDQLLGTKTQYYYGVGIVGEAVGTSGTTSPYVDLPTNLVQTSARVNGGAAGAPVPSQTAAFLDISGTSSSFESATLEQLQALVPGFQAASTVRLFDVALQQNDTIYDINPTTWATVKSELVNYKSGDISAINTFLSQNAANTSYRVITPSNGSISLCSTTVTTCTPTTVPNWTGVGYKTMSSKVTTSSSTYGYGEQISGGLSGGFGVISDPPVDETFYALGAQPLASSSFTPDPSFNASLGGSAAGVGLDPLDLVKGSFQYQHSDLTVGSKGFPYGLGFERLYDSNAQGTAGPLGSGWTHNYSITATVNSDGFAGMGQASALNAVSSIVALYVSSNLVGGQTLPNNVSLENFVLESVVNRWFTDQLTNNVVTVTQGWNSEEFVQMPSGSYSAPLGSATVLANIGANLTYVTKTGVTMTFDGVPTVGNPVQIATWANAAGASVSFSYSGSGSSALLSSVTSNSTGRSLRLNYNGSQIASVSDGTGRSVSYTITGGNLTQYTDALSQNTIFSYGGSYDSSGYGHLTQIFYPSNPSNAFVTSYYDGMGRVFKQQDALGNTSLAFFAGARSEVDDPAGDRHVYYNDPFGNVLMEIQDYGSSSHLNMTTVNTYNGQELLVSKTLPEGNSTTITAYDSLFNPLTVVQSPKPGSPLSPLTTTMTYTVPVSSLPNFEEIKTATDPKINVTTYFYDSTYGNLTQVQQPVVSKPGVGNQTPTQNFTYTSIGLPQTVQDAEGRVTRYDYYASNPDAVQKTTVDYGRLNYITQYSYDPYGDVCTVTDPNGNVTTSVHDVLQRVTEVDAPNALGITKSDYYPDGQVHDVYREQNTPSISSPATCISNSTETSPVWETTTYTYTLSDKVQTATDPLGNVTTTAYDLDDRVYTVTQPVTASPALYRVGISTYDILSRPNQVSVGSGSSTSAAVSSATVQATYFYTLNGKQQSVTDANGHSTSYTYDGFDRLSVTTYPDSTSDTEQYTYDADSNVTQKTARSGMTIAFSYDALNRVQTKTPQGEAAGQVTYGYDLTGRLMQATDTTTTTPYAIGYDTAGRPTSFTDQVGNNTQVAYDGVGNRTQMTWPAGTSGSGSYYVTYQYDVMNRMQYVKEGGTGKLLAQYNWDALSRAQQITYGDGTSDVYSQYDAGDNLKTMTQNYSGAHNSVTFSYTWLMNHQRSSTSVSDMLFQYVPQASTENYGPADVDNGLTSESGSLGNASMTYDGNHNLTYDGFNSLAYDVENRLIQAENASTSCPSTNPCTYQYDPLGQRKEKVVNGTVATAFVLAGGSEIADYYASSATWRLTVRGAGGLPLAEIVPGASEQIVYVHHDVQGSTVALTVPGETGPAESYTYSDYGQPQSGSWSAYQYGGYRYDSETGLYYVSARYYSAVLGRFLQSDPAGFGGGFNLYAYVGNDPINLLDPTGMTADGSVVVSGTPTSLPLTTSASCSDLALPYPGNNISLAASDALQGAAYSISPGAYASPNNLFSNGFALTTESAANMTANFLAGTGPTYTDFGTTSPESQAMAESTYVREAMGNYIENGVTDGVGNFEQYGLGPLAAGANPMAQFVGGFSYSIASNSGVMYMQITNYTSLKSATYEMGTSIPRSGSGPYPPMSTTVQTYDIAVRCP